MAYLPVSSSNKRMRGIPAGEQFNQEDAWHTCRSAVQTRGCVAYLSVSSSNKRMRGIPAGQQFKHEDAEGPEIGRDVVAAVKDDLRGDVLGCATERPRLAPVTDLLGEPKVNLSTTNPSLLQRFINTEHRLHLVSSKRPLTNFILS